MFGVILVEGIDVRRVMSNHEWISIPKCLLTFLMLNGMIYVDKRRTKKIIEFQIGIKPATPSMSYWEL